MPVPRSVVDEWIRAAQDARTFTAAGDWGEVEGVIAMAPATAAAKVFGRVPAAGVPTVALIAPPPPGLEQSEEATHAEDALASGLLRAGVHVGRARHWRLAQPADLDPQAWIDAVAQTLEAAVAAVPQAQPALAGAWLSGAACALVAARRDDLAFLVLAAAPVPEVMSRRTSENEDDPAWSESPTLRLVDALSPLSPLQAITAQARPVLLVQGACDESLPVAHMEAWRAALAATGRGADGIEIAFADGFFRMVAPSGAVDRSGDEGHALLAASVAEWTRRTLTAAGAARPPR